MRRPLLASAAVGVVLGGAGFGVTWALAAPDHRADPPPGDRTERAIHALTQDHLYIGPEEAWRFTDDQVAQVTKTVQQAPVPTYLVYWDDYDGDWGVSIDRVALDQIMASIDRTGYYVMVDADHGYVTSDAIGYAPPLDDSELSNAARPGPSLVTYLDDLAQQTPEKPWDDSSGGDVGGSIAGGVALGLLGAGVLAGLVWIGGAVRRLFA